MRILALIGVLAILIALGTAAVFFGGFYSVAGTAQDPAIVAWALVKVRQASISHHAAGIPPMSLDDSAVVQAGARAFATRGCINCHGGPGVKWAKFSEGLNPSPPDLKEVVSGLEARELFWVIKNGINMTGMPSFGQIGVSDQDYKTWTASSGTN